MNDDQDKDVDIILNSSSNLVDDVSKPSSMAPGNGSISPTDAPVVLSINSEDEIDRSSKRRMRRTSFQARLGRKMDTIQRRVLDNNLRLSSNPTDMLRISIDRDERSRDIISRTLKSMEIIPIILPSMEKIPMRHLEGYRGENEVTIPSLYTIDQNEYFEVFAPVECKLKPDDLIVRIIYDDVNCPDDPYVMILQISEQLASIGYSSIKYYTYWATFYNEKLPNQILDKIKSDQIKRRILGW